MKTTVVIGHVTWLTDCGYNQFTDCSHNVAKIVGVTNATLTEAVEDCFSSMKNLLSDLPTVQETSDGSPIFPGNYEFPKHNLRMEVISGELVLQVCRNGGDKVALIPTKIDGGQGDPIALAGIKPTQIAHLLDLTKIEED